MFTIFCLLVFLTVSINACPPGTYEWQNECYTFVTNATGFADAESHCIINGGHLTSIHDGFTNAWIKEEAFNFFHESSVSDFWIGLTDLINPGNWSWTDGSSMNFTELSKISNLTGSNCVSATMTNSLWQASDCFMFKPYVCKSGKPVYPAFEKCPWPLIYFQPTHSCYGDGTERKINNWTQAERYCMSIGGHLPSVHSSDEINFLWSIMMISGINFWVGATSNDGGLTWKWSDNTPWDFNPWSFGYPNRTSSGCAVHWGSGLADKDCSETRTLICQVKL